MTYFTKKGSNEKYMAQIGIAIMITLFFSIYILRLYGFTWLTTAIYTHIIIHIMYILMATDHIISAMCLNSLTYLLNIPVVGNIFGYIGVFGLLLVSPIYLIISATKN